MWFLAVGGIQYLLDAGLFALLISAGIATTPANITSRATAAAAGFVLNRYVTFGQRNDTLKRFRDSLLRFVVLWVSLTVVSTLSVLWLESVWGSDSTHRIMAKLAVEAVLAVVSFVLSRWWVFRN